MNWSKKQFSKSNTQTMDQNLFLKISSQHTAKYHYAFEGHKVFEN